MAIGLLAIVAFAMTFGLLLGYRPVAITTGSMDPWAPTGALVIAGPVDGDDVEVGDVLVMETGEDMLVTHRVIDIRAVRGERHAVTQGDANEDPDPLLYPIGDRELEGRWAVDGGGRLLVALNYRVVLVLVVAAAIATLAQTALRWIWNDEQDDPEPEGPEPSSHGTVAEQAADGATEAAPSPGRGPSTPPSIRRRASLLPVATALATLLVADASYALFTDTEAVTNNNFSTVGCATAGGITLQRGTVTNTTNAVETITISAVDPAKTFLTFTTTGTRSRPRDSMVLGELVDPTTVRFTRSVNGQIRPMSIEWAVVEYACGVEVQRGTVAGNGATTLDIPISTVDPAQSFVLMSIGADPLDFTYNIHEMIDPEILNPTTLRLNSYFIDPPTTYGWQVISFTQPGAASVQRVSTTLNSGVASTSATIPTPVDWSRTFIIANPVTTIAGPDLGSQAVRVSPGTTTNVNIVRERTNGFVDVHLQIVTLNDGTAVQYGRTTLPRNTASATATITAVDTSIATAMSTVGLPGSMSGGSTRLANRDRLGIASAAHQIIDPTTVQLTRNDQRLDATFVWQVIEWAK